MAFLNYEYKMTISYSEPVAKCYFTIKSIPLEDFRQRGISYNISMFPEAPYSESKDSFGNIQIIGSVGEPHSKYEYITDENGWSVNVLDLIKDDRILSQKVKSFTEESTKPSVNSLF